MISSFRIGVFLVLLTFCSAPVAAVEKVTDKYIDCRPQELKKAEEAFESLVKPHLAGIAERYNTRPETLQRMTLKRQELFRKWLRIRCTCQPPGMSRFEQTFCQGLSDDAVPKPNSPCLLRE